ncbi:MAG: hypothetical protein GY869_00830 [Planctomycetes bacterium]|nr:hypothetical protein [Planctomycetota bacterium]
MVREIQLKINRKQTQKEQNYLSYPEILVGDAHPTKLAPFQGWMRIRIYFKDGGQERGYVLAVYAC